MSSTNGPKRSKRTEDMRDLGSIGNCRWNDTAGGDKVIPIQPKLIPLGDPTAGIKVDTGSIIALFNTDTVVHYAISGTTMPSAPTGGATGVALPAGQYFYYAMGADNCLILDAGSATKVFAYRVVDESTFL